MSSSQQGKEKSARQRERYARKVAHKVQERSRAARKIAQRTA